MPNEEQDAVEQLYDSMERPDLAGEVLYCSAHNGVVVTVHMDGWLVRASVCLPSLGISAELEESSALP